MIVTSGHDGKPGAALGNAFLALTKSVLWRMLMF